MSRLVYLGEEGTGYVEGACSNIIVADTMAPALDQGCALAAPGHLRRLTFGLGRLKKKSGRPSGRLDFSLSENLKRNEQTY